MLLCLDAAGWTAIFTAGLVIATLALWISALRTQRDLINLNRAIIIVTRMRIGWTEATGAGTLNFIFKNYGKTVATNVEIRSDFSDELSKLQLRGLDKDPILPPGMRKAQTWPLEGIYIKAILSGEVKLFVGVQIRWTTMDKKRFEYSCTGEFVPSHGVFATINSNLKQLA